MNKSTWREQHVAIPANTPIAVNWNDTSPNIVIIANNGNSRVYIGQSANVNPTTYDIIIPPYGTRLYARPLPITTMWLFSLIETRVHIASMEGEFSPLMISQTQEISAISASGLLGTVDVNQIYAPLPAGTNEIGSVQISGFGEPLPAGTNEIGKVRISGFDTMLHGFGNLGTQPPSVAVFIAGTDGSQLIPLRVSQDGRLVINELTLLESYTHPLSALETFESQFHDVKHFSRLVGYVSTDQNGTLKVYFSHDDYDYNYVQTHTINVIGGTPALIDIPVLAQYVHFKYENGTTEQNTFSFVVNGKVV